MNYDILQIHNDIIQKFYKENENLSKYKNNLSILLSIEETFSPKYQNDLNHKIKHLRDKIYNIENNIDYNYYLLETHEIVQTYKDLLNQPLKVSFFSKQVKNNDNKEKTYKLYMEYISIAKKYTSNDIRYQEDNNIVEENKCTNCMSNDVIIYENEQTCISCGNVEEFLSASGSTRDIEMTNTSTKYTYDRQVHFKECMDKFQGKYTIIDPVVFVDIEKSLNRNGFVKPYKNLTKGHILLFLKEYKHSKHYYDVNYLYHHYTNNKKHDIQDLEEIILQDFDTLLQLYNEEYKDDRTRKNFINTHFVLFQLLKRHKYPCQKEDFNILKTPEKRIYHDEVVKHLFMKLNWNYYSII